MSVTRKPTNATPATTATTDATRRRLIRALGGAGASVAIAHRAFSDGWKGPVVDSVMVPAHALTTIADVSLFGAIEVAIGSNIPQESILNWMLQPAHAGVVGIQGNNRVCISVLGGQVAIAAAAMWVPVYPPDCEEEFLIPIEAEQAFHDSKSGPTRGSRLADFFVEDANAGNGPICQFPFEVCGTGSGAIGDWINLSPSDGLSAQLRVLEVGGTAPTRYADVQLRRRAYPGAPSVDTSNVERIFEEFGTCSCSALGGSKKSR